jgi:hypothetical protein
MEPYLATGNLMQALAALSDESEPSCAAQSIACCCSDPSWDATAHNPDASKGGTGNRLVRKSSIAGPYRGASPMNRRST